MSSLPYDTMFMVELNTNGIECKCKKPQFMNAQINGDDIKFKVESGAIVTGMMVSMYNNMANKPELNSPHTYNSL